MVVPERGARAGKPARRKSVVLAAAMGLVLSMFGTFYFGWRTFLLSIAAWLVAITCSVLLQGLFGLYLPVWSQWVWPPFFALACGVYAALWNDALIDSPAVLSGKERWQLAAMIGVPLGMWEFRVSVGIALGYTAVHAFSQGQILSGALLLIALPAALSLVARWLGLLLSLVASIF